MVIGGTMEGLRRITEKPGWSDVRATVRRHLADGDLDYASAIGQPFRNMWDEEAYAAFALVRAKIIEGEVLPIRVPLGHEPLVDRAREGNAEALLSLPLPYRAELRDQNNSPDGDGDFWWDAPMTAHLWGGVTHDIEARTESALPLEIGSSHPGTTWEHLARFGGVARWPYGSLDVVLFLWVKGHSEHIARATEVDY